MPVVRSRSEEKLYSGILRLNTKMLGLILGLLCGLLVFVATNWLVLKGGTINGQGRYVVGPHMELLGQFFIGYRVSFLGSIIGFCYAFAIGTLGGALVGWIYNRFVDLRN